MVIAEILDIIPVTKFRVTEMVIVRIFYINTL
jgi:hypothetical protein